MKKPGHKKKNPKGAGRKKIKIDWDEFEKLCAIQCTLVEIADWFKCSEDTIERRCKEEKKINFAELYRKHSAQGRISLRRSQFKYASKGNPALLIFLGKQYLAQKEKHDEKTNTDKPQPIKVEIIAQDGRRPENKD